MDTRPVMPVGPKKAASLVREPVDVTSPVAMPRRPIAEPVRVAAASNHGGRVLLVCGFLMLLVAAVGAGWFLRGRVAQVAPAAPARQPVVPIPPETETAPIMRPTADTAKSEVPIAVPKAVPAEVSGPTPLPATDRESPDSPAPGKEPTIAANAGPSFDCRTVQTRVNRMICDSPELAAADVAMASAYRAIVGRGDRAAELRLDREQAAFLNARAVCDTGDCIGVLMQDRLAALRRGDRTAALQR